MKKIIVAVAALALMAGSAYAAEWNFYGSARVSTFWSDTDADGVELDEFDDYLEEVQFDEHLQTNARIGANVKVSDELTGRFEYGASGGVANVRLLYGEWEFVSGKLLVGKDYVPMYLTGSNQVVGNDAALSGWGEVDGSRRAQIKLTFGDFQVAFVENNTDYYGAAFGDTTDAFVDVVIPMIQLQYALTFDNVVITMAGGYQTFDVDDGIADDDVTSWGLGLDVAATFGAFSVTAQLNGGTNVGNIYNIEVSDLVIGSGYAAVVGNEVIDNDAMGGRIAAAYTINEMLGVEVGYGYQQTEFDVSNSNEDEVQSYYIQLPITLAPGVHIVPEVGVVDYMDDANGEDESETTYFGAKWQINF
ncbi:hypothetical protein [Desulfobacter postgatei]|jgi:hypothetical protein|uniref:hypothetical protein n=1 Tax=Desulfobacter postgatei TaxID=2293 RepID=UPI002A35DE39|nr:hypothetical protein [Desulfobacter postgatei]MDX9963070.1 hypothetical protein [Desulfobacter postgatei]